MDKQTFAELVNTLDVELGDRCQGADVAEILKKLNGNMLQMVNDFCK
jgi:hypothetical protein